MADKFQIDIAIDSPIIVRGLTNIIDHFKEFYVNKIVSNGVIEYLKATSIVPFALILDIESLSQNNGKCLSIIKKEWSATNILVFSFCKEDEMLLHALYHTGCNILPAKMTIEELYNALTSLKGNKIRTQPKNKIEAYPQLTIKEKEFITFICSNLTYKEIADKMSISSRTVETHRDHIFRKLNINSRSALIMHAIKLGLINNNLAY